MVAGDTLYMIAKKHDISLDELMEANPMADLYNLRIGMVLCIPRKVEEPCPAKPMREDCYHVRTGDNMDRICNHFRVLPRNLMKANPHLTVIDYSVPGTRVCIPSK